MPAHTVLKSKEYRQIIGFLTTVIDQTFLQEKELSLDVGERAPSARAEYIEDLRERRDAAYIVLEKVLEIVLRELTHEDEEEDAEADCATAFSLSDQVFSGDERSVSLRNEFEKSVTSAERRRA